MSDDVHPVACVLSWWFRESSFPLGVPGCGNWQTLHDFFNSAENVMKLSDQLKLDEVAIVLARYEISIPGSILDMVNSVQSAEWRRKLVLMSAVRWLAAPEEKVDKVMALLVASDEDDRGLTSKVFLLLLENVLMRSDKLENYDLVTEFFDGMFVKRGVEATKNEILRLLHGGLDDGEKLSSSVGKFLLAVAGVENQASLALIVPDVMEVICRYLECFDESCLDFFARVKLMLAPELLEKYVMVLLLHVPEVSLDDMSDLGKCSMVLASCNLERIATALDGCENTLFDVLWSPLMNKIGDSKPMQLSVLDLAFRLHCDFRPYLQCLLKIDAFGSVVISEDGHIESIDEFRRFLYLFTLSHGFPYCEVLITSLFELPLAMAELFVVLKNEWSLVGKEVVCSDQFVTCLADVLHWLNSSHVSQELELVRCSVVEFILCIVKASEFAVLFERDSRFNRELFCACLKDNKCGKHVVDIVASVWSYLDIPISSSPSNIAAFIGQNTELFVKLATIVNEVLLVRGEENEAFRPWFLKSVDMLNDVTSLEMLHGLLGSFMFMTDAALGAGVYSKIQVSIEKIEGDEPSDLTLETLLKLLTEVKNRKTICRPGVAQAIVGVHLKSVRLGVVLDRLLELCALVFENALRLHNGKLDIFILDLLRNKIPQQFQKQALRLFSAISVVASSAAAAHRFIGLLCPIQSHFLPDDIPILVKELLQIFERRRAGPQAFLRLDPLSSIDVSGIPASSFHKDFILNIVFFRNGASFQYPARIIQIQDAGSKPFIHVEMIDDYLYVNSVRVPLTVPTLQWTLLRIHFLENHRQAEVAFGISTGSVIDVSITPPRGGSMKCTIGGVLSDEGYESVLLSSLSISTGDPTQTSDIFAITGDVLLRMQDTTITEKKVTMQGRGICPVLALPDVISQLFKLDSLIPLLAQMDMKCKESGIQLGDSYRADIIRLLTNAVSYNEEAEQAFVQSKCFKIIAFLLYSQSSETLTYLVYMHFHALCNHLQSENSKHQAYKNILLNTTIWSRAEPEQALSIISHWKTGILLESPQFFCQVKPVRRLIIDLLTFTSSQPDGYHSTQLRLCIREIMCIVAKQSFALEDLQGLVSACLGTSNSDFQCDVLSTIVTIAEIDPSPFATLASEEAQRCLASLSYLVECQSSAIHIKVLETILVLHTHGFFSVLPLSHHLDIFCCQLTQSPLEKELVENILSLVTKYPRLLSVLFRLINHGGDEFLTYVREVTPKREYALNKAWCLWPFVVAVNFSSVTEYIFDLVIRSTASDWTNIFNFLDMAASSLNKDPFPLQRQLLTQIGNFLMESELTKNNAQEFIDITQYFVVVKPLGYISPALKAAFEKSPFGFTAVICDMDSSSVTPITDGSFAKMKEQVRTKAEAVEVPSMFNVTMQERAFYSRMEELQNKRRRVKFGLAITEDRKWADMELVKVAQSVIVKYNLNKLYSTLNSALQERIDYKKLKDIFDNKDSHIKYMILQPSRIAMFVLKNSYKTNYFAHVLDRACSSRLRQSAKQWQERNNNKVKRQLEHGKKLWLHLWRSLTIERGPWEDSLPKEEIHFKRDNTLCVHFYPAKLKRNRHFQDHKDAAISRDIGSIETARETRRQYDEMKRAEDMKRAPPELFQVDSESHDVGSETQNSDRGGNRRLFYGNAVLILPCDKNTTEQCNCVLTCYSNSMVITENDRNRRYRIKASDVKYLLLRPYLHFDSSFSVITCYGQEFFIYIPSYSVIPLLRQLSNLAPWNRAIIQKEPYSRFFRSLGIQDQWVNGKISNFDYLMKLNFFSGRSFLEPSLYPFFPWIIQNYSTETLDLDDDSIFRDLSKPMGTMSQPRLDELRSHLSDYLTFSGQNFLYNSCYVSPLCVFLWLMRLEPFTTLHINLQSGKFDHAARLFASMSTAFKMASCHMNDYRELVPEFFFCPAFFENRNHFDLGQSDGKDVNDVELPKWASSSMEFIYIHRKVLESDRVSEMLHQWIDLMWGYKQTGKEAVDADNTFDPMLYQSIWTEENLKNEKQRRVIESMLIHCGHIPPQLFRHPHPPKLKKPKESGMVMAFTLHLENKDALFGRIDKKDGHNFQMMYCNGSGEFLRLVASPSTGKMDLDEKEVAIKADSAQVLCGEALTLDKHMKLFKINGHVIVKVNLKTGDTVSYEGHHGKVNCMAISNLFVVSGGCDTIVNIWRKEDATAPFHTVTTFRDEVVCCDVSDEFHLAAACTRDGSLFLISTTTGVTARIIDLTPEVPVRVAITAGWGFVVVHSTSIDSGNILHFLHVFNVDGDLIRRRQINFSIKAWTHWVSYSGFDHMVFVDEHNKTHALEVFYLDAEPFGSKVPPNIIDMRYFVDDEMLVIMTDASISFYPSECLNISRFNRTKFGKP